MDNTRKLILHVVLLCLGLTAVAGVLAVMTGGGMMWSLTWSVLFATVCSLFMLYFAGQMEKPFHREACLLGMVIVAIEFVLVMTLTWGVLRMAGLGHWETDVQITAGLLAGWGLMGIVFLRLHSAPFTRVAGLVGIVMVSVSFLMAIFAVWMSSSWSRTNVEKWWPTTVTIGWLSVPLAMSLSGLGTPVRRFAGETPAPEDGELRQWRWIGVAAGGIGALAFLTARFWDIDRYISPGYQPASGNLLLRFAGIAMIVSVYVGVANIVLLTPLQENQRWIGLGTLASGLATAAMAIAMIMSDDSESMVRLFGAVAIPTVCGILALSSIARMNSRANFASVTQAQFMVNLTCPRCRNHLEMKPGPGACDKCKLKIELKIEEPRCVKCGYLLYMLERDDCPECGKAIVTT